ncbi:transcription factor MYB98-like [Glycine soja]|uniref:transcription factor MYB98 n=1 Tax=Glycine max TaxID=3847 RepID=UPI0003DE8CFF|nr:transcription factor MYB98 [Glycine max]XP_028210677.1 transcription factor MYB98-like [Glycine soja]|eukprot:XP_006601427.1 transcription factor MYB98 [Glycine max]
MSPSSVSVTPLMDNIETNLTENYASESKPMHLQENYLKPSMEDQLPFGTPSTQGFLQDSHHIDHLQFHVNGSSSSNPIFGVQTPNFDPFDHNCKLFAESNGSGHAHLMDNFQYVGYSLNLPRTNQLDLMVANQSYVPFNALETKPLNFVVPDEVSCISPPNYYKRVGLNKNLRESPSTRITFKARKKSNIVKGQWTSDEDRLLIQLVEQYGLRKWSHIAQALPGRIGKQCRERWHNHLRPDIKKDIWTEEEDKILIQAHAEIGNKWAEIAKKLPGRTENSIKNHWNATKRRQYSKRKCRSKYPRGSLLQEYIKSLNLDKNPPIDYRKKSDKNANAKTNNNGKAAAQPQCADQFCPNGQIVPRYDFNEVPDFSLDDNLFEEGCSIDSLLDDMQSASTVDHEKDFDGKIMQCAPTMDGKQSHHQVGIQCVHVVDEHHHDHETEMVAHTMGNEVKKEFDLVEMMSHMNGSHYSTHSPR